jgi:proteasome lid subunit RPN8/RPN11
MSDSEIQFGEVEQPRREQRLRPDRNQQWAVVACGEPDPRDLPIFVDLDVMRELEDHARSDRRVELAGVFLGGQLDDEAGNPYVVVQDSLRARHYESSRGSFKFTHDTWSDITRRRDQFPPDLEMVGWYHTHPDWGVFLSGMDLFICEHFFNRALDVALVIDPCRGQRGWFQWTGDSDQQIRPTAGFYLIASRHRRTELERYAAQLEGGLAMAHDSHSRDFDPTKAARPVTSEPDPRGLWLAIGGMGILTVQLLVLLLIAWRILFDGIGPVSRTTTQTMEPVPASPEYHEAQLALQRIEAQRQLLDRVVAALDDRTPENLVSLLENQRHETQELQADLRAYRALEIGFRDQNLALAQKLEEASELESSLRSQIRTLDRALSDARSQTNALEQRLATLQNERIHPDPGASPTGPGDGQSVFRSVSWWMWVGPAALILILLGASHWLVNRRSKTDANSANSEDESADRG